MKFAMTKQTLYLFPDTNLFIQCRPLEQLDWSEWEEFEEDSFDGLPSGSKGNR